MEQRVAPAAAIQVNGQIASAHGQEQQDKEGQLQIKNGKHSVDYNKPRPAGQRAQDPKGFGKPLGSSLAAQCNKMFTQPPSGCYIHLLLSLTK
jgi:hypothetical protein